VSENLLCRKIYEFKFSTVVGAVNTCNLEGGQARCFREKEWQLVARTWQVI
jgi:hypothetical protein